VGVGTVYRHFASKDALIDELLRLALEEVLSSTDRALARTDGHGLEEFLRALGQSFADHARYADLFLQRRTDDATSRRIRAAVDELTARAIAAGTVNPGTNPDDVLAIAYSAPALRAARASSGVNAALARPATRLRRSPIPRRRRAVAPPLPLPPRWPRSASPTGTPPQARTAI
jgi:AcrR family transcriptional regulator